MNNFQTCYWGWGYWGSRINPTPGPFPDEYDSDLERSSDPGNTGEWSRGMLAKNTTCAIDFGTSISVIAW